MKQKTMPELLAPAGDFSKLKSALHFGADAIYLAGESFGLRKASKNFSKEELEEAVKLCHDLGRTIHVTMNIVPHDEDLIGLSEYASFLDKIGVDACIVSDPGIFMHLKKNTNIDLHISTQASVTNSATINFWKELGAKRIVLARELSLEEIKEVKKQIGNDIELECFVHGAMCISYSGRCLLSNYMTGRDANQGDCAQACRWKYYIQEEKRPGESYPIVEDDRGTFIMNSKDLCLLPYLDELMEAGIDSFKIEGRVKSEFYLSTVINAYRKALNAIDSGKFNQELVDKLLVEIKKTSHRAFTTGFLFGNPGREGQNYESTSYIQDYDFLGIVKEYDDERDYAMVQARNKFIVGDRIEVLRARGNFLDFNVTNILSEKGNELDQANCPMDYFWISVPDKVEIGDIIRKIRD